jgi:putative photosynthetic complex assembly protein
MRDALDDSHVSPLALAAVALVLAGTVMAVAAVRLTGATATQVPVSTPVQVRAIRFEDRPDGSIAVFDAGATAPYEIIAPQTNGFLRGTLRGMARARKLNHAGSQPPFELTRWADGRLSLRDPVDGRELALEPFGPVNTAVFKRLLTLAGNTP